MIQYIKRTSSFQKLINKNHEFLLALWPCLLIFRASIPWLEYLFILYSIIYLPYLLITTIRIKPKFKRICFKVIKDLAIPLIVVGFFFIAFILTKENTFLSSRQLLVAVFMLSYLVILKIILTSAEQVNDFLNNLVKLFLYISLISAILGIIKYLFQVSGINFSFLYSTDGIYPAGTALKLDHNFNSLVYIIGGISLYFYYKIDTNKAKYLFFLIAFFVLFFAVTFSSSRRSIVILILLLIITVIKVFFTSRELYRTNRIGIYYIRSIAICLLSLVCIYSIIRISSSKFLFQFKSQSTYIFNDYISFIQRDNIEYNEAYRILWGESNLTSKQEKSNDQSLLLKNSRFDNLEEKMIPWESLRMTHHVVDTLKIIKVEGYKSNAILVLLSEVDSLIDTIYVSTYVKINKFFRQPQIELRDGPNRHVKRATNYNDGKWHYIETNAPNYSNSLWLLVSCGGESVFNPSEFLFCDITVSGNKELVWKDQKILDALNSTSLPDLVDPAVIDTIINLDTISIINHSNLYYKYDSLRMNHYLVSNGKPGVAQTRKIRIPISQKWTFYVRSASNSHNKLPRLRIRNLANRQAMYSTATSYGKWNNYRIDFFANEGDEIEIDFEHFISDGCQISIWNSLALFNSGNLGFKYPETSKIDTSLFIGYCDSIKPPTKFIQNINQNKKIVYDNSFFAPRLDRWTYAFTLFNENSIFEKIFGEGFDYTDDYSMRYNILGVDYPHNVFLSVLLSSGLIGLLFFIYFLIDVIKRYIRSKEWMLFIIFLITFFYMIFSGDTIFELPLLTFFMFLPYVFKIDNLKIISQQNSG